MVFGLHYRATQAPKPKMTLRIQRDSSGCGTTIRLIGRIQSRDVQELKEQLSSAGPKAALDLDEVTLVDVDVVRFLRRARRKAQKFYVAHPTFGNGCFGRWAEKDDRRFNNPDIREYSGVDGNNEQHHPNSCP